VKGIGRRALIGFVVGLAVGLIIGLPVLGWWLFPVKWTDTDPFDLKREHKETYIAMVADSYAINGDLDLAKARLRGFDEEEIGRIIAELVAERQGAGRALEARRLRRLGEALELGEVESRAKPQPLVTSPLQRLRPISRVWILIPLAIIALLLLLLKRGRVAGPRLGLEEAGRWEGVSPPLERFLTTYSLGDDDYDAYSIIEGPTGEVIGGYGIGISEAIGKGRPRKVTAFELWLYDKSIVRTVAKVLMSKHAFSDSALQARLASRGEAVLAEKGKVISLETEALGIRAEVVDLAYGSEPPTEGYFTRLAVELALTKREKYDVPLTSVSTSRGTL